MSFLHQARQHAAAGRFAELLALCEPVLADLAADVVQLLDLGALLSNHGFLTDARTCYEKAQTLAPADLRATVNLANLARDAGEHGIAHSLYNDLLRQLPDHPVIRRNALTSLEYDPEVLDADRLGQAQAWGAWAIARAGGIRARPALQPLNARPLRIGYVSADLCQQTVGLFVKEVLKAHDPARVQVFAYSAGAVNDWATDAIRTACIWRDVGGLDDAALAEQIRADGIEAKTRPKQKDSHFVCPAYLCGDDTATGKNHDHRRGWIVDRVKQLAGVFAIDVAAYTVMSNHYHLVLRVDVERAQGWSNEEVLRRWTQLYDGPLLVQRLLSGQGGDMDQATLNAIDEWAATYRARLSDISWFMRILNETVARQANAEDKVTGHFWEGRFKSQALLDEQAILTAMAYVDLNPIRAKMADTPEVSDYTSVAERMATLKPEAKPARKARIHHEPPTAAARGHTVTANEQTSKVTPFLTLRQETHLAALPLQPLMTFDATCRLRAAIPFAFEDYLDLVETTGRSLHAGKRGLIAERVPELLQRLEIDPERFIDCTTGLMKQFGSAVGAPAHLTELRARRQVKYLRGIYAARGAFGREVA